MNQLNPQLLYDLRLALTVTAILLIGGAALFIWKSYQRRFFTMTALLLASVVVERIGSAIKNYHETAVQGQIDLNIIGFWFATQAQLTIVAAVVFGYYLFGRNGVGKQEGEINGTPPDKPVL